MLSSAEWLRIRNDINRESALIDIYTALLDLCHMKNSVRSNVDGIRLIIRTSAYLRMHFLILYSQTLGPGRMLMPSTHFLLCTQTAQLAQHSTAPAI